MKNRTGFRLNEQGLLLLLESFQHHRNRVVANRHGAEFELPALVCFLNLRPVGILSFQRDRRACNGQVLRIVNDASYRAENRGVQRNGQPEKIENDDSKSNGAHRLL